ncbi:vWA domain-containing protein [Mucilaginibacter ginsenosidivorans]|uniref:VWA domain-containing protein n=1 Tax=Mucilaginibacter ginsenosidivorans TaxID=398053 RepID=A0A5B8V1I3_9SPHI|nr:VWA domain-containing protein [Mucilaginibacter ginsenosidivorans]QEC65290.1 VWA domain-containing protein [Mucilaginibacter ginsenosidivorans]
MQLLFSVTWGTVSGWWTPICLLLGLLYAWLLYRSPSGLAKKIRYALFAARTIAVFITSFLLIAPLVRSVSYTQQKPLVLIVQDNSQSIGTFKPGGFKPDQFVGELAKLKEQLGDKYDVREFNFSRDLKDSLSNKFDGKQTNISSALDKLNERFANQNIGALVLVTDGLYNQGSDPLYEAKNLKTSVYTVALGDTTARRDLLIGNVNYNKTAFLGNDFVIEVLAEAFQANGETIRLNVSEDGKQVANQNVEVNSDNFRKVIPLKLNADKKGIRKFTIDITPVKNELSVQNNSETIYVDVLDARQKILLLYDGPHPDISTIKQGIEVNKNYEVKTSLLTDAASLKLTDYSLVILYQCVSNGSGALQSFITKGKVPVWYMLGAQTDLPQFNNEQKAIQVYSNRNQVQEVFPMPASDFSLFTLSDSTRNKLSKLPPLIAPFGNYRTAGNDQLLLKQRIGEVPTPYPLLLFGDDNGRRIGVLTGEGLWRWSLAEYQSYGNHHATEELLGQCVQYLTANSNRQRFRVYPAKNVFDEGENIILNAELYNEALQLVNTPDIKINLKSDSGKNYSFLFTRSGQSYQLDAGTLPVGDYGYTASAKLGDQNLTANGRLTIKPLNLETRQTAADHKLLAALAQQSGGQMLQPSQVGQLADLIQKNENIKTVVYEDKHYSDLVGVKWIFVFIVALLSAEWFLRKREGEV